MSNGRAKRGGQIGINGHRYEGGQFLPSSKDRLPGSTPAAKATGKQEIAPFKWETPPAPGLRSLYKVIGPGYFSRKNAAGSYEVNTGAKNYDGSPMTGDMVLNCGKTLQELIDLYNNGERWI